MAKIDDILAEVNNEGWTTLLSPSATVLSRVAKRAGATALANLGVEEQGLTETVDDDAVDWAMARAAELVGKRILDDGSIVDNPDAEWSIVDATREMLRGKVATAIEEGWSAGKLQQEIEGDTAFSPARAKMIARTETAFAHESGNEIGWERSGVVEASEWVTADDPCPICEENEDAGPVDLGEPFPSGDIAPPAHPHCECTREAILSAEKLAKGSDDQPRDEHGRFASGGSHEHTAETRMTDLKTDEERAWLTAVRANQKERADARKEGREPKLVPVPPKPQSLVDRQRENPPKAEPKTEPKIEPVKSGDDRKSGVGTGRATDDELRRTTTVRNGIRDSHEANAHAMRPDTHEKVQNAVNDLPANMKNDLAYAGYRIRAVSDLKQAGLSDNQWAAGNCSYTDRDINIGQSVQHSVIRDPVHVLHHEIGHATDRALRTWRPANSKNLSREEYYGHQHLSSDNEEFRTARLADIRDMPTSTQRDYAYWISNNLETFAETFSDVLDDNAGRKARFHYHGTFSSHMPRTAAWMRGAVEKAGLLK